MERNNDVAPPPYTETDEHTVAGPRRPSSRRASAETVPPYTPPQDGDEIQQQPVEKASGGPRAPSPAEADGERAASATGAGPSSPAAKPSLLKRAKQAHEDWRSARESARKVDFYEKTYGFVPKNVMTEAEWRAARERAPKEKVPFTPAGSFYLLGRGK